MKKTYWHSLAALASLLVIGGVWAFAGRTSEAVAPANELGFPNQWRWKIHRVPVVDSVSQCQLVIRHRVTPIYDQYPLPPQKVPLTAFGVDEEVIAVEVLPPHSSLEGAVAIDLLDFRQMGEPSLLSGPPYRIRAALKSDWATSTGVFPMKGHSLRGQPVIHSEDWQNGECNLLTFTSFEPGSTHVYTVLLAIRPRFE